MEQNKKTIFQYKLANFFIRKGYKGTFVLPTGTSKSRIPLINSKEFIDNHNYQKGDILIVVPTEVLRDVTWPEEIRKWLGDDYKDYIDIECIQSIYLDRTPRKFVIFDEIHNYIPNYTDYVEGNKQFVTYLTDTPIENMMGLTAFIPPRKRKTIDEVCPILFEMSVADALKEGFISNFHIYNIPIPFSEDQRIQYNDIQNQINKYAQKLGGPNVAYVNAESILRGLASMHIASLPEAERIKFGIANKYRKLIGERKLFLEQNKSKVEACIEIVTKYNDKSIIFSASKEVCDIISQQADFIAKFHSGVTKKKRAQIIETFSLDTKEILSMAAVNAINEGVNVPQVKLSVLESGNSSIKDFLQRLGRNLRIVEGERSAMFVQLYIPDTQDEKWMKSRIYGIPENKMTYLNNYKEFLNLL